MTVVAMLGVGAMGSRMALHWLDGGVDLRVYNRTRERTRALGERGAFVAADPAEAVAGADVAISMVTDDEAARAVWLQPRVGAVHGLAAGCTVIESSTVTPAWIATLRDAVEGKGGALLDAPVVGTLPQAERAELVHCVGGSSDALDRARPVLRMVGSAIHHVGDVGAGATLKLAINALYAAQIAMLGETLGWLGKAGISPTEANAVLGTLAVTSPAAKHAAALIEAGRHDPLFPIALVDKDLRYASALASGADTPVLAAVAAAFARASRNGAGGSNITAVAGQYLD